MSEENVEMVERGIDAFNRRDTEALLAVLHEEIEWDSGMPGASPWRGHDGLKRMLREVETAWEGLRLVPSDFKDFGETVIADCRLVARGRTSGATVAGPQVGVIELSGGLLRRVRIFTERAEALEAAGLSE